MNKFDAVAIRKEKEIVLKDVVQGIMDQHAARIISYLGDKFVVKSLENEQNVYLTLELHELLRVPDWDEDQFLFDQINTEQGLVFKNELVKQITYKLAIEVKNTMDERFEKDVDTTLWNTNGRPITIKQKPQYEDHIRN